MADRAQTKSRVQPRAATTTATTKEEYQIELIITPDGQIASTVLGVCGPDCEGLTEWLDNVGEVTEHHATPDARRNPEQVTTRASVHTKSGG